jgi:hypothetical protein
MNRKTTFITILATLLIFSCKSKQDIKMSSNLVMNKIIQDYYKSNKYYIKDYSVFHIQKIDVDNSELDFYTIIPENDEIAFTLSLEDSVNDKNLPTNYLEYKNKLFLWREGNQKTSDTLMQFLYNKKLVDSSYVKYQLGLIPEEDIREIWITTDDGLKSLTYIFCKSNPLKIKKKIISGNFIYSDYEKLQIKCK